MEVAQVPKIIFGYNDKTSQGNIVYFVENIFIIYKCAIIK